MRVLYFPLLISFRIIISHSGREFFIFKSHRWLMRSLNLVQSIQTFDTWQVYHGIHIIIIVHVSFSLCQEFWSWFIGLRTWTKFHLVDHNWCKLCFDWCLTQSFIKTVYDTSLKDWFTFLWWILLVGFALNSIFYLLKIIRIFDVPFRNLFTQKKLCS